MGTKAHGASDVHRGCAAESRHPQRWSKKRRRLRLIRSSHAFSACSLRSSLGVWYSRTPHPAAHRYCVTHKETPISYMLRTATRISAVHFYRPSPSVCAYNNWKQWLYCPALFQPGCHIPHISNSITSITSITQYSTHTKNSLSTLTRYLLPHTRARGDPQAHTDLRHSFAHPQDCTSYSTHKTLSACNLSCNHSSSTPTRSPQPL